MANCRHPTLYFEDGNIVFLTSEGTLFKFHKTLLALHSVFFDDMFTLASHPPPKSTGKHNEELKTSLDDGSSDESPVRLLGTNKGAGPGISNQEMETIGKILYESPFRSLKLLSVQETLSVLHVSTKFMFEDLRKEVIASLEAAPLDPWQRYSIAVDHSIEDWLLQSYLGICTLIRAPSVKNANEFARRNEFDDYIRVSIVREEYRTRLLIYALNPNQLHPYVAAGNDEEPSIFSGCEEQRTQGCRTKLKRVLTSLFTHGQAPVTEGPNPESIYEYVQHFIAESTQQTNNRVCSACRGKKMRLVTETLGRRQLENELKKLLQV